MLKNLASTLNKLFKNKSKQVEFKTELLSSPIVKVLFDTVPDFIK